jgi:type II secretory pathway component PulM
MAAAYVMVFAILVGTYAASIRHERRQQKLEELRAEQQRIESDLRQVKAIADEAQPVVVLENGDTHVIVDLKQNHESIYY